MIRATRTSIDVMLYRLNQPRLARALHAAARRGVRLRVILDLKKFELTPATQEMVAKWEIPFRLMSGRGGRYAKMHHKAAILDGNTALAGSYNWTDESEENNYEHLVVIRDRKLVEKFRKEFESLWKIAGQPAARRRARRALESQ